ncbi:unnamed protein product [Diplocarpon coronariae]
MPDEIFLHANAFDPRSRGPRIFRPGRRRARSRREKEREPPAVREITAEEDMDADPPAGGETQPPPLPSPVEDLIDRVTLCLPPRQNEAVLPGPDEGVHDVRREDLTSAESRAAERLVDLKARLQTASTHHFWAILMEEICDIAGSQCGLVAKRIFGDGQDSAGEAPERGAPGACLMGVAIHITDGSGAKKLYRDRQYSAYGTPCAHMLRGKVLIVPERLAELTPSNPNAVPWGTSEAFVGVPLFAGGSCFAHLGMVWSPDGSSKRRLSWSFIEMLLHSLEDMIVQRLLEGRGSVAERARPEASPVGNRPAAIPAAPSLQPYARSLSHELRTPMQGVVGMLDIMHSTVRDAIPDSRGEHVRSVFEELKRYIEVVQESSRRAVEAADNVVHAYDLNMQMPPTPLTPADAHALDAAARPDLLPPARRRWPGVGSPPPPVGTKRERTESASCKTGPPPKRPVTAGAEVPRSSCCPEECNVVSPRTILSPGVCSMIDEPLGPERRGGGPVTPAPPRPAHRRVVTRQFMRSLVDEALRHGHCTSEERADTDLGEQIRLVSRGARGERLDRTLVLEVGREVPEVLFTGEPHLRFALRKLVDNALKFTEHGTIRVGVRLARSQRFVEVWVGDTGCGISAGSRSHLFEPHFQEDASIRRSRDGLGLSLFNAKARVRKNLGGDVTLQRSATHGPSRGSEFLVSLPISALTEPARPDAPGGTPPTGCESPPPPPAPDAAPPVSRPRSPDPTRRPAAPPGPRRRVAHNPKLATDYPLNILIAEDNAINRNVAIGALHKLGYSSRNITVAFDGLEAVEQYRASLARPPAERFTVILMDIWMPNLDGYEATTKILELARAHSEPTTIVAVTADITEDSVDRARAAGMHGFLAKPYKVRDLERVIVEHF